VGKEICNSSYDRLGEAEKNFKRTINTPGREERRGGGELVKKCPPLGEEWGIRGTLGGV